MLRGSNLVRYDHQTETWWQQFTGEALVGKLAGRQLRPIPTRMVSWAEAKDTFADIKALTEHGQELYLRVRDRARTQAARVAVARKLAIMAYLAWKLPSKVSSGE